MPRNGTLSLLLLQNKLKRDPSSYKEEFLMQLRHFESTLHVFELRPKEDSKSFLELLTFVSHTAPCYPKETSHLPQLLMQLLEKHFTIVHPNMRRHIVMALILLRNKDLIEAEKILPFFFKLFRANDKELRKMLISHIISDVKRLNLKTKNQKVNSKLQGYMYHILEEDDSIAALYSLMVMIDLYRRRIWTNDQTVNIIAKGVFSKHSKILMVSLRFLLGHYAKMTVNAEETLEDKEKKRQGTSDREVGKQRRGAVYQYKKAAKKTSKRLHKMERTIMKIEKGRGEEEFYDTVFPAIEVLYDPQTFGERLFAVLQKTHEGFDVRILIMKVLSKVISAHKLMVLGYYTYLERYMEPFNKNVTHLLVTAIESVHDLIPPDAVQPLMMAIANHFITDKVDPDVITIGINTVREICRRQPLLMTESLLHDIAEYKTYKKDKGVTMAAKG